MSQLNPTSSLESLHPSNSHSTCRVFWSVFSLLLAVMYSAAVWSQQSDPPTDYKALSIQELTGLAEQGDANAQNQLGIIYETGRGTSQDPQQAAAWYQKAAEQGYSAAQSNHGVCLIRGTGVDRDVRQGVEWIERSAAQRDPNGLRNLGYALEQGWLGKKKISEAAKHYRQAVFAGHASAYADLERLAKTGNAEAEYEFGTLFEYGVGREKDLAAARAWYEKAAAQKHLDATAALGIFLHGGLGGPQDQAKAVQLLRAAAQGGSTRAVNALGECYFSGTGIEKDQKKAIALVKLAADRKLPVALTSYGCILAHGLVGDPDLDQAAEYYYRAAVRGHQRGETLLRTSASEGNAVAADCLKRFEAGDTEDVTGSDIEPTTVAVFDQTPEAAKELLTWLEKHDAGHYNEAIDGLYEFVKKHPQDHFAWYILGACYQEKEMPWEAKQAMDHAITIAPNDPQAYISKAGLLVQQKRFHEAAETLEQVAKRAPLTRPLLERLVSTESEAKRFRHVIQYGEILWALQESPSAAFALALAHHFLEDQTQRDEYAAAYERLGGEPDKLQKIFETSQRLQQDKEKILEQLTRVGQREDFEAVLKQVRRYLNYDPCAAELWMLLGLIRLNDPLICTNAEIKTKLAKYKDDAEAIEHLSNACYLEEQDVLLHQKLANAMVDNGEFQRARAEYQRIMQRFPDVANTYSYAALLALKMSDYDRAVQLAERAREINDQDGEVLAWLATVYHFAGQEDKRDEVRREVENLVQTTDNPFDKLFAMNKYWDYGYYGNSAVAQDLVHRMGEYTKFVAAEGMGTEKYRQVMGEDYQSDIMQLDLSPGELLWRRRQLLRACRAYLEQYPKSFYVQVFLGHICSTLERYDKADKYFQQSLETNPDFALTYFIMAVSHYFRGDRSAAVQLLRQACDKDPTILAGDRIQSSWKAHWLENDKRDDVGIRYAEFFWEAEKSVAWIPARLAECYHRMEDTQKRDEFLEHARKLDYAEIDQLEAMIADGAEPDDAATTAENQDPLADLADSMPVESSDVDGVQASSDSGSETASDSHEQQPATDADKTAAGASSLDEILPPAETPGASDSLDDAKSDASGETARQRPPVPAGHDRIEMEHYYLDVPEDLLHTGDEILGDDKPPAPFECMVMPRERVFGGPGATVLAIAADTLDVAGSLDLETVRQELSEEFQDREIVEQVQIRGGTRPAWRFRVRGKATTEGVESDNDYYFWHFAPKLGMLIGCWTPAGEEHQHYRDTFTQIVRSVRMKPLNLSIYGDEAETAASPEKKDTGKQPVAKDKYMPACNAAEPSKEKCKQADKLCGEGKYDEAIRLYNQAIQLDRGHVCAYTGIGCAEGLRGDQQMGMDQMNRTVDMFPDSALALIERGRYALTINRVDLASKDFDQAIKLSYCSRAYELRAYCFLEHGRDQSALNYLDMAIKIYPASAEAYRLRARAHRGLGHHDQAAADDAKAAAIVNE